MSLKRRIDACWDVAKNCSMVAKHEQLKLNKLNLGSEKFLILHQLTDVRVRSNPDTGYYDAGNQIDHDVDYVKA